MSLNGSDIKNLLKTSNTTLTSIDGHLGMEEQTTGTSHNNVGIRHGIVPGFSAFVQHSSRHDVNNTGFFVNSMNIPTPTAGLDITFPTVATILGVASTSINDDVAGTGGLTLLIEGLDINWDYQADVVVLTGRVKALSNLAFIRINELTLLSTGSGGINDGDIYVADTGQTFGATGLPTTLCYSTMGAGWGWGAGGVYSTARNTKTAANHFKCSTDATTSKPLLLRAEVRPFGLPVLRVGELVFTNGASNFVNDGFNTLNGKTDFILRSMAGSAGNIDISVMWWSFIISADPTQGQ